MCESTHKPKRREMVMARFHMLIGPVPVGLLPPRLREVQCSCLMLQVRSFIHSER
jgi:hypothetical protein